MVAAAFVLLALQGQAEELIERLRSDSVEERTRAAKGLEALGAAALPALQKAAIDSDAEVAARARAVLQSLPFAILTGRIAIPGSKVAFEMAEVASGPAVRHQPDAEGKRGSAKAFDLRPFWIGKREVCWEEFQPYYDGRKRKPAVDGVTHPTDFLDILGVLHEHAARGPRAPASYLHWHSVIGYCDWLSKTTGLYFRPPTEAEWEHASRSGLEGQAPDSLAEFAWFKEVSDGKAHDVGVKKPNRYGLHDMLGNVWEYCLEPAEVPAGRPVLRGGGWSTPAAKVAFEARDALRPEWYESDPNRPRSLWFLSDAPFAGFRVVRVPGALAPAERDAVAGKIALRIHESADAPKEAGTRVVTSVRIGGEIENRSDRVIEELEVAVFALKPDGTPHWVDGQSWGWGRPTYNKGWPVLPNSAWAGEQSLPLPPGGVRKFVLDLPKSFDEEPDVAPGKFGARVTAVCPRK